MYLISEVGVSVAAVGTNPWSWLDHWASVPGDARYCAGRLTFTGAKPLLWAQKGELAMFKARKRG